jgi:hypothetical protein
VLIAINIFCSESLDMIQLSEIQPGDLIKVVVVVDDVEDELFARVSDNRGDYLEIFYYEETSLIYKGARVYALESELNIIRVESICEHYLDNETIFEHISDERYVLKEEIDSEEDSTFYDESNDSGSDLRDFIVSDNEMDEPITIPHDHEIVDKSWDQWNPPSEGSRSFKRVVDDLEARARVHMDNVNF